VVVDAGRHLTRWLVSLPEGWCPPVERSDAISTGIGLASNEVHASADGLLVHERSLELHTTQVGPDEMEALEQLAVFAARAARRSIRLRCSPPGSS